MPVMFIAGPRRFAAIRGKASKRSGHCEKIGADLFDPISVAGTNVTAEVGGGALVAIITAWCLVAGLLCPPAHAADTLPFADAMVFDLFTAAPIAVAAMLVLAWCCRTMRRADRIKEPTLVETPPTAPTLTSLEQSIQNADAS